MSVECTALLMGRGSMFFFGPVVMFYKLHVSQPLCFMCNAFYIGYFPSQIMVCLCFILFVHFNVKYDNIQSGNACKYSAYVFLCSKIN